MTLSNAKICRECGSLNWYISQYATTTVYGRMFYGARSDGSYIDDFERGDDSDEGDWEDSGDGPQCSQCDSDDFLDLDSLTQEQFKYLYELPEDERVEVVEHMVNKVYVFPKEVKDVKYIGGRKVKQQC